MKCCPQCHRVETDDALAFCRADGTALISDSGSIGGDAGTARFGSASASREIETSILPHRTEAEINRPTAPTTVLPATPPTGATRDLANTQRIRVVIPLAALAVVVAVVAGYFHFSRKNAIIQSIAVMPFENASGDADLEYLSDGMTEALIKSLSQLPNLNVKARSTVFRYKGRNTDAKTIRKELGIQALLNGRVIQRGDQLILNLELIDAQTENVIWTDQYDRKTSDLVSLQSEIARDVSSKLKLKLSGADAQKVAKTYTADPAAYRLYLQGRFYWNTRAGKEFDKAENYFRQALEKDPNFALGYVGLADYYGDRERGKAKENVNRALALDPDLAEAQGTLGYQYMLDYDFVASERHMKRALELDPRNLDLHRWNGQRLMMLGRYDEAFAAYRKALEIDPNSSPMHFIWGACLIAAGQLDEGVEYLENSIKADPSFVWSHSHLSFAYRFKNNYAGAAEQRAIAQELLGETENARLTRESFARGGRDGFLREMVRQGAKPDGVTGGMRTAAAHALLGENEKAMALIELSAKGGEFWLFTIKYDPAYDALRGDPRFQALVKKFDPSQ